MNMLEHEVVELKSFPYLYNRMWCIDVVADCRGYLANTTIFFESEDEANSVCVGFKFLA